MDHKSSHSFSTIEHILQRTLLCLDRRLEDLPTPVSPSKFRKTLDHSPGRKIGVFAKGEKGESSSNQHNQLKETEDIQIKVPELQGEILGEKCPDTFRSMAHLALIYRQQGQLEEAEEREVKALKLQREILGEKHPDTLGSMADLASIYKEQGRSKEAKKM